MKPVALLWALGGEPTVHVAIDPQAEAELGAAPSDALEDWLSQRLVEEGWSIGDGADATIVLRVHAREDAVWIEASRGMHVESIAIDDTTDALGRLEMLHHAIAVLERLEAAEVAPAPTPEPKPEPKLEPKPEPEPVSPTPATRAVDEAPVPHERPPIVPRLYVRGGVVGRRAAIDPAITAGIRVGLAHGPGARVEIGAWPSGRSAGIAIVEVPAMAGFGWSFALGRRVELEPVVQGGVLIHAWRFDGIRRAAIDGNFELPVELAVRVGRALRVAIVPSIGVTTRARRHVVAAETVWSRGSLRGGIALGIAWQPERGR